MTTLGEGELQLGDVEQARGLRRFPLAKIIDVVRARSMFAAMRALGLGHKMFTLSSGETLRLRTNDRGAVRLVAERWYEPGVRTAIRRLLRPGMTVVDVGANIGYYTVQFSSLVGPSGLVLAFEPQETALSELQFNLRLNACNNVVVIPVALSDSTGTAPFYFPEPGNEGFGGLRQNSRFTAGRQASVPTALLDDVLEQYRPGGVDLIKIDAEGAELSILRGARGLLSSKQRPLILFEAVAENCAPFGYTPMDLFQMITGFGYRLERLNQEDWLAQPQDS
jgi:FkbM family methyltransferase